MAKNGVVLQNVSMGDGQSFAAIFIKHSLYKVVF